VPLVLYELILYCAVHHNEKDSRQTDRRTDGQTDFVDAVGGGVGVE